MRPVLSGIQSFAKRYWALALLAAMAAGAMLPAAAQDSGPSIRWFEIETLNAGLGAAPEALDRSTPRATVESFLNATALEDFDRAAHFLDLAAIAPERQKIVGPNLAEALAQVIDRRAAISWSSLRDRPDGLDDQAGTERAVAGEPRRSMLIWSVDTGDHPIAIRLARVKGGDAPPVWVFSRQTVDSIPALAQVTAPYRFEEYLPQALRENSGLIGLKRWEIVAMPLLLAAATLLGLTTSHIIGRLAVSGRRTRLDTVVRSIRAPVTIAAITGLVWWTSEHLFVFSAAISVVLSPLIATGFVLAVMIFLINTLDRVIDQIVTSSAEALKGSDPEMQRRRELATGLAAIRRVAIVLAFFGGVAIVLASADAFASLGWSLLASAGVLTLIAGFAARNVLANIMASLQIALNRSAKIGDELMFQGYLCNVERINFTFVQLRVWTGERLVVPVTTFVEEVYENWNLSDGALTRKVTLKLAPDVDLNDIRTLYHRVLDEGEYTLSDPENRGVHVTGQDVFGMDVLFRVPAKQAEDSWEISCDVHEKLIGEIVKLGKERGQTLFPEAGAAEAA